MEVADYYGGRRRMTMRNPMRTLPYMGGADLMTTIDGTVVPYDSWKQCASSNWKDRKVECAKYRKPRGVRQLKYPELQGLPVAERMAFLRSLKVKGAKRGPRKVKVNRRCNFRGVSGWKLPELKAYAKSVGFKGFSKMNKAQLCQALNSI